MAFDELDSFDEDQKIVISAEDAIAGNPIPLNMARFEKVGQFSIFVEDNQGGLDSTVIVKMQLLGQLHVRNRLLFDSLTNFLIRLSLELELYAVQ
jgi:hypothetical protein